MTKARSNLSTPAARSRTGTAATSGQQVPRVGRTGSRLTVALKTETVDRAEVARAWTVDSAGRALSKPDFISEAVDEKVRRLLESQPLFKLPPHCAFESM